jgi:hypothetical protein
MGDMVFGGLVLVGFLALIGAAGLVLYRWKNARLTRAWAPLVPVIDGRVRGDGGGAARSWLSGSYAGHQVEASLSPNAADRGRVGSTTTGYAYNAFEIMLGDVPGQHDWSLLGARGGDAEWRIETADEALRQRLEASPVVGLVAALGHPSPAITTVGLPVLAYVARDRLLHLREDAGPVEAPAPDRFRTELDTLLAVAELNRQVNGEG